MTHLPQTCSVVACEAQPEAQPLLLKHALTSASASVAVAFTSATAAEAKAAVNTAAEADAQIWDQ